MQDAPVMRPTPQRRSTYWIAAATAGDVDVDEVTRHKRTSQRRGAVGCRIRFALMSIA
jgi:hypothetical protein